MSARVLDGATLWQGGREWTWHEDVDDEGRRFGWSECGDCGGTVLGGDDARQDHACVECPGCHEWFPSLPVIDSENSQSYCTDDCHDDASERYWTAVLSS